MFNICHVLDYSVDHASSDTKDDVAELQPDWQVTPYTQPCFSQEPYTALEGQKGRYGPSYVA